MNTKNRLQLFKKRFTPSLSRGFTPSLSRGFTPSLSRGFTPSLSRGFTLIELLVVISIIGVLAALIVSNLNDSRARARDTNKKQNLNQLKTSLRMYYNDYQSYPTPSIIGSPGGTFTIGSTTYMKKLPDDFTYTKINDDSFTVYAILENASDPDIASSQTQCIGSPDSSFHYYVCAD
ncbi:type II secretion system GspH family protein [Patescibacteria group bacterium]|nr:type II secretion system GspH family protein [Patescibacteria group bacterium]